MDSVAPAIVVQAPSLKEGALFPELCGETNMRRPISVQETAELVGISEVAVLKRIAKGTLVAKRFSGKAYMVSRDSAEGREVDRDEFEKACSAYVSVPEACNIVCVTDGMVGRMLADGRLDGFRLNRKAWAVSRKSCEKNLAEKIANPGTGRPRDFLSDRSPKKKQRKTA